MKRIALLALVAFAASGCITALPGVSVYTNLPIYVHKSVEIVNNSHDYLSLTATGSQLRFDFPNGRTSYVLRRGESVSLRCRNFTGGQVEGTITAKAWTSESKMGDPAYFRTAITGRFTVPYGYTHSQAATWIITDEMLAGRYGAYQHYIY